jgi:hypothetical protein
MRSMLRKGSVCGAAPTRSFATASIDMGSFIEFPMAKERVGSFR